MIPHDIDTDLPGITIPQSRKASDNLLSGLALPHASHQAVSVHIVEAMQWFDAFLARVGRSMSFRFALGRPAPSGEGAEFQRAELIITDDRPALRTLRVKGQNTLFLRSQFGSCDCFQVLVGCQETPSRCSSRRHHSGLTFGKRKRLTR